MLQSAAVRGMATQSPPTEDQILVKLGDIPDTELKGASPVSKSTNMDDTEKASVPDASQGPLYLNYDALTTSGRGADDGIGQEQSRGADSHEGNEGDLGDEAGEESMEARIERLGRERPQQFKSLWAEVVFVFSISMSQVLSVSLISKILSDGI